MRRSFSFVLVMLLVLRGLLGDAMAMGVAPVALPTAPLHQQAAMAAEQGVVSHHQGHAGTHSADAATTAAIATTSACTAEGAADSPHCGHESGPTCSACGICHSALFAMSALLQPLALQPVALQSVGHTPFASAAAALAIKPPIS